MKSYPILLLLIVAYHCSYAQTLVYTPKPLPAVGGVTVAQPQKPLQSTIYQPQNLSALTPAPRVAAAPQPAVAARPAIVARAYTPGRPDSLRTANGEKGEGGDSADTSKSYCYVINATDFQQTLLISYNYSNWQSASVNPEKEIAVQVQNRVYLRIWDAKLNRYDDITGYPWKYYTIK